MRAYQREYPEIERRGGTLVAISPQRPDGSLTMAETNELGFDVLSDVGNEVARSYGLLWKLPPALVDLYRGWNLDLVAANGDERWELPIPGTFVIDREGVIRLASVDADYRNRLEPTAILETLDALE